MDAGAPGLEPYLTAFPGHKPGAGSEVEQMRLELVPKWHADFAGGGLAYYATTLSPIKILIITFNLENCSENCMTQHI